MTKKQLTPDENKGYQIAYFVERLRELSHRANDEESTDIGELWELTQGLADAAADRIGVDPIDWEEGIPFCADCEAPTDEGADPHSCVVTP
jgi:hypothetical protein